MIYSFHSLLCEVSLIVVRYNFFKTYIEMKSIRLLTTLNGVEKYKGPFCTGNHIINALPGNTSNRKYSAGIQGSDFYDIPIFLRYKIWIIIVVGIFGDCCLYWFVGGCWF